jgi:VIT1/CCC1 family predicted Fe2+/Mn2+ transporter
VSFVKNFDSKLMHLLTLNFRYRDWSKAPLSYALLLAVVHLLAAALCIVPMLISRKVEITSLIAGFIFIVIAFYHWRLWRRLGSGRS